MARERKEGKEDSPAEEEEGEREGKAVYPPFFFPSLFLLFFSLGALIAALYAPAIPLLSSPGGGTVGEGGREPSRAEK